MDQLRLREGLPPRKVLLTTELAHALMRTKALEVTPTEQPGEWLVAAGTRVGALSVGGMQVIIEPKIPIKRLLFLMTYALNPDYWREDLIEIDEDLDLTDALAHAFVVITQQALGQGLLKGYRTVDEQLPVLRGRLREADQIRRRFGVGLPLEVTYDDYSVDIAENQLLLAATHALLRAPGVHPHARRGLQRLRIQLADVTPTPRCGQRPAWIPSRLNNRYVPALVLSELILNGGSFEQRNGSLTVTGYLLNMAQIFEDFVCVAFSKALQDIESLEVIGPRGHASFQHRVYMDEERTVLLKPDFCWERAGAPVMVADAKYKAEKPSGFLNADLYQLLAYCTVLGLHEGHLIYAKGEEAAGVKHIVRSGVTVNIWTLDPQDSPSALLRDVSRIARIQSSLCAASRTTIRSS